MCRKAVIFDFNGTMFQDTGIQERAWQIFFEQYYHTPLTAEDFSKHIHGRPNKYILNRYCKEKIREEQFAEYADKKEGIYRALCVEQQETLVLTEGLENLLNTMTKNNVKMAIATSSGIDNVKFYSKVFRLDRWFLAKQIIHHDGLLEGKPAPDIYLKAAEVLHQPMNECIVVEDAVSGIQSAYKAGAGHIIALAGQDDDVLRLSNDYRVDIVVKDFNAPCHQYICGLLGVEM